MAEHPGTVEVTVVFQFGAGESACLDVIDTVISEHYLLTNPVRDDAAGRTTSTFTIDVAVDPDGPTYRVVHPEPPPEE